MDANEIIKAAPAIAKVAGPLAAAIPFTGIVKRMLGPAADELAEMLRDSVRLYRYERQIKCLEKAERMAQEAGFTPQAVPPKILFPLLEGASFEDISSPSVSLRLSSLICGYEPIGFCFIKACRPTQAQADAWR